MIKFRFQGFAFSRVFQGEFLEMMLNNIKKRRITMSVKAPLSESQQKNSNAPKDITVKANTQWTVKGEEANMSIGTLTLEPGAQIICEANVNWTVQKFVKKVTD